MPVGTVPLWTLDWITLGGRGYRDRNGIQWILMEETGFWDSPAPRTDSTARSNAHGSYVGPIFYEERIVTIKARAYCDNPDTLRRHWALVNGLCADPEASYRLSCTSEIGTLECAVRRDGAVITTPVALLNVNAFEFSIQLIAADPRKYSTNTRTMRAELPSADTGDGLDFEEQTIGPPNVGLHFTGPGLYFGAQNSSGGLLLTNDGTAPTAPVYELHGPLDTPTITAHGHRMTYNDDLGAGERIVIDPSQPSVLLGGTASRRWLLNPAEFAGFYVPAANPRTNQAGTLNVGLTHRGGTDAGGYLVATLRDAYF